jgi:hypothetical protein
MKFADIIFLGALWLVSAGIFGAALFHEYNYDQRIQSEGRAGTAIFIRIIEKGKGSLNKVPAKLPICEYSITENETGKVQLTKGECQSFENKTPFQTYYLPQKSGHKLLRIKPIWSRPIILILGIIFLFFSASFFLFLKKFMTYRKIRSASQSEAVSKP